LPEAVTAEDYAGLVERRQLRGRLERRLGKYEGRRKTPPVEGEFGGWAREAWYETVESGDVLHQGRGVDVTPCFWGDALLASERGDVNWAVISRYLARESAKCVQKKAPPNWPGIGRAWGLWGGIGRLTVVERIAKGEFDEERRPVRAMQRKRIEEERRAGGLRPVKVRGSRGADGGVCFLAAERAQRLHDWAASESRRKAYERQRGEPRDDRIVGGAGVQAVHRGSSGSPAVRRRVSAEDGRSPIGAGDVRGSWLARDGDSAVEAGEPRDRGGVRRVRHGGERSEPQNLGVRNYTTLRTGRGGER